MEETVISVLIFCWRVVRPTASPARRRRWRPADPPTASTTGKPSFAAGIEATTLTSRVLRRVLGIFRPLLAGFFSSARHRSNGDEAGLTNEAGLWITGVTLSFWYTRWYTNRIDDPSKHCVERL